MPLPGPDTNANTAHRLRAVVELHDHTIRTRVQVSVEYLTLTSLTGSTAAPQARARAALGRRYQEPAEWGSHVLLSAPLNTDERAVALPRTGDLCPARVGAAGDDVEAGAGYRGSVSVVCGGGGVRKISLRPFPPALPVSFCDAADSGGRPSG